MKQILKKKENRKKECKTQSIKGASNATVLSVNLVIFLFMKGCC